MDYEKKYKDAFMIPDKIYLPKLVMAGAEILDKPISNSDVEYIRKDALPNDTPLPEDTVLFNKGVEEGKRLMMEEAVEGEIQMKYNGGLCAKTIRPINEEIFHFGDKVRVIVLPNTDEK